MKGIDVIVEQAGSRYQVAVVRVLGQIDTTTSHELERRLQYLLKDQQFEIAIDLSKVSYISSAGWGIFISEIRGIRESGGDLKLAGMTPEVAEVFELLEFHNILESYRTVEAAVEKFDRNRLHRDPQMEHDGLGGTDAVATAAGTGEGVRLDEDIAVQSPLSAEYAGSEGAGAPSTAPSAYVTPGMRTAGAAILADGSEIATRMTRLGQDIRRAEAQDSATARPENKSLDALICEIVKEDPEQGCLKIRKELSKRGHRQTMGPLAVYAELKRLNLESRDKRRKYVESGRTGQSEE